MASVWDEIEQTLLSLYNPPHNQINFKSNNTTPDAEVKKKMAEVKSGLVSVMREDFWGPALFLRVVGPANRLYSGEWWFDAKLLDNPDAAYSRIYYSASDKKRVLRDMLRELLAVSKEWNRIEEVWALELPPGATLRGYAGPGTP